MKELGNVLWLICGGFVSVLFWGLLGALFCATVIGIPLGKQLFKVAKFAAWPFTEDMEAEANFGKNMIANIIWLPFGLLIITAYIILGAAFSVTLIGAPFGKVYFKLVAMTMAPFGVEYEKKVEVIKEWEEWKNW